MPFSCSVRIILIFIRFREDLINTLVEPAELFSCEIFAKPVV
jgi:hypothetical protein